MQSNKRWKTVLFTIVGLAGTLAAFYVLSLIWPYASDVLGHAVLIPMLLVSAFVAITNRLTCTRVWYHGDRWDSLVRTRL